MMDNEEHSRRFSISTYNADYTTEHLAQKLINGEIYIPDFQRRYVWDLVQASKFIESLVIGLPVPGIFLMEDEEARFLIIDGHNRLTSIRNYYEGSFKLRNVQPELNGKSINELDQRNRLHFLRSVIHATIIRDDADPLSMSSAFEIFRRLNTGGTAMQAHELRSALYNGTLEKLLRDLNEWDLWRQCYGRSDIHLKDEEAILRFFALQYKGHSYKAPMSEFLDYFMAENAKMQIPTIEEWNSVFVESLTHLTTAVGTNVFRRGRLWNYALYDFSMNGVAKAFKQGYRLKKQRTKMAYELLCNNDNLLQTMKKSTDSTRNIFTRLDIADKFFKEII